MTSSECIFCSALMLYCDCFCAAAMLVVLLVGLLGHKCNACMSASASEPCSSACKTRLLLWLPVRFDRQRVGYCAMFNCFAVTGAMNAIDLSPLQLPFGGRSLSHFFAFGLGLSLPVEMGQILHKVHAAQSRFVPGPAVEASCVH